MSRLGKVIVAMSGGVDSSVAACLLKEQGYECIGVFMRVGAAGSDPQISPLDAEAEPACAPSRAALPGDVSPASVENSGSRLELPQRRLKHGCCSATDALDARLIAAKLGIPFYALNLEHDFGRIIDYFVAEYTRARTPNPCVMCNIHLKFGKLLRYADMLDAEFVATGHYARIVRNAGGVGAHPAGAVGSGVQRSALDDGAQPLLARAVNRAKDQSYVLFGIQRRDLARCLFPLGEFRDKADVRRIAGDLGLRVHAKPDSQEICFVPENDYRQLIDRRDPGGRRPGPLADETGNVVGTHAGYQAYTVGQRRGLGVALGRPAYVTRIDAASNTVVVGPREALLSGGLLAEDVNWLVADVTLQQLAVAHADRWIPAAIKIRHTHLPAAGAIRVGDDRTVAARFDVPQAAVTPGQAAVFYDGEIVLGGGWIRAAHAAEPLSARGP